MTDKRFGIGDEVRIKESSKEYDVNVPRWQQVGKVHHHFLVYGEYVAYVEFNEDTARYIAESELEAVE